MNHFLQNQGLGSLLTQQTRHRVFVSYHHGCDQAYYNAFAQHFHHTYEVIQDRSLRDAVNSDNSEYVMQRIRSDYITGTSCTIVLCGLETPWRKFVDWEIKATLDREHGLIGINLPTNRASANGRFTVPDRLHANIQSGYAMWTDWQTITKDTTTLPTLIAAANTRSATLIQNPRDMMFRNLTPPWRS
jgi:hypothetical protein